MTSSSGFWKPLKFPNKRLSQSAVKVVNKIKNLLLEVFGRSETTAFKRLSLKKSKVSRITRSLETALTVSTSNES